MGVKDTANLALIPAAYKASKVYSAIPTDGDGDFTFTRTGNGTRINKAGLIETVGSNVPRLNYRLDADGNPSSCPELLLEPERTNQILYSKDFTNSAWQKLGGGTGTAPVVTADYTTAPDGTQTADRVIMDMGSGTTGDNYSIIRNFGTSGSTGTNSIYMKSNTTDSYTIGIDNVGTVETVTVTPQWQRFSYSVTNSDRLQISLRGTGNSTSRYADVSLWGGSLENGDYVTSFIPTTTFAVTRNIDECFISFSGVVTDYPFTLMSTMEILKTGQRGYAFSFLNEFSNSRFYSAGYNVDGGGNFFRFDNAKYSNNYNQKTTATYEAGIYKVAVKFVSDTNFIGYINGLEVVNKVHPSSTFDTGVNDILVGQLRRLSDTTDRNPIKEFYLWTKALTDAEMVEITSYTSFTEMATQQQFTIQ